MASLPSVFASRDAAAAPQRGARGKQPRACLSTVWGWRGVVLVVAWWSVPFALRFIGSGLCRPFASDSSFSDVQVLWFGKTGASWSFVEGCKLVVVVGLRGQRKRLVIGTSKSHVKTAVAIFLMLAACGPLETGAKACTSLFAALFAGAAAAGIFWDDQMGKRLGLHVGVGCCLRKLALSCGVPCLVRVLYVHLRVFGLSVQSRRRKIFA